MIVITSVITGKASFGAIGRVLDARMYQLGAGGRMGEAPFFSEAIYICMILSVEDASFV